MNKKLFLAFWALLLSTIIFAQDTLRLHNDSKVNPYAPAPLIIVKGDAFKRFPSGNFLDAVNGLFPWVFSQTPNTNDFLFVVNGFLFTDINSISLNDIEEVSFSRNNMDGNLYPFSRAGTFYITTHTYTGGKTSFNFNTQYDAIAQKDNTTSVSSINLLNTQRVKNQSGHLFSNHLSVLTGGKKWELYVSAQLNQTGRPKAVDTRTVYYPGTRQDSSIITSMQKQTNITSFAQFTYHFLSTLSAGVSGGYFHGATNSDTSLLEYVNPNIKGNMNQHIETVLPYYHAEAFVNWTPVKHLSNRASAEYAENRLQADDRSTAIGFSTDSNFTRTTISTTNLHNKRFLLRDELNYSITQMSKFRSGVKVIFSYFNQQQEYKNNGVQITSNGGISSGSQTFSGREKLTSLNPEFYFSYNQLLSGYGGYTFLLNKGVSAFTAASKTNPYAGIVFDIKRIIKTHENIDRLDLSIDYADLTKNNLNDHWLPGIDKPSEYAPASVLNALTVFQPVPPGSAPDVSYNVIKNRSLAIQANTSFLHNRLSVGLGWSVLQSDNLYGVNFGGFYYLTKVRETQKGLSAYVAANLLDKNSFRWTMRLTTVLMPHASYKNSDGSDPHINSLQDQLQAGLQNTFTCKNWYAQANGLFAQNNKTVNTFLLNYLLVGYQLSETRSKLLQKTSVFLQARNLLSSNEAKKYYGYYSYAGAGINLAF